MKSTRLSLRDELGLVWRRHRPALRFDLWFARVCIAAALGWVAFITISGLLK